MKPSFWLKIGSYLTDVAIEQVESEHSGTLEVICRNGRYALCTQNAVYSYDDLYLNFRQSFQAMNLRHRSIQNVLVLGLGLGSIPLMLEKVFKKKYNYTLVEIDEKVISLAYKYTLDDLESSIEVVCQDAAEYIYNDQAVYDLIAIDLFIDDITPSIFESIKFLNAVKQRLAPNALLMYNRLTYNDQLADKTEHFFKTKFKRVFKQANQLSLNSNKMLFNKPIDI